MSSESYLKPVQVQIDDIGVQYEKDDVQINFGASFREHQVHLFVDEKEVFAKFLTTPGNGTGLTDSIKFKKDKSQLDLRLVINKSEWKIRVDLNKGRFFHIAYQDGEPSIYQATFSFYYD
jgi:hypothetical protein